MRFFAHADAAHLAIGDSKLLVAALPAALIEVKGPRLALVFCPWRHPSALPRVRRICTSKKSKEERMYITLGYTSVGNREPKYLFCFNLIYLNI